MTRMMKAVDYSNPDDAIAAASKLEARGEWDAAVELYRQVAERWPERGEYVRQCIEVMVEKQTLAEREESDSCLSREPTRWERRVSAILRGVAFLRRAIGGSVVGALIVLGWDVVVTGSFLLSFFVFPVWFVFFILTNAVGRPGWKPALLRIAVPPLTLGLVLANDTLQRRIADANAAQVIAACEEFRVDNGELPETLDELVPRYMGSVPRAKYCLCFGEFLYWSFDGGGMLVWYVVPPYGRRIYDFEEGRWRYLD